MPALILHIQHRDVGMFLKYCVYTCRYFADLDEYAECDVIIVGAGSAGKDIAAAAF